MRFRWFLTGYLVAGTVYGFSHIFMLKTGMIKYNQDFLFIPREEDKL